MNPKGKDPMEKGF